MSIISSKQLQALLLVASLASPISARAVETDAQRKENDMRMLDQLGGAPTAAAPAPLAAAGGSALGECRKPSQIDRNVCTQSAVQTPKCARGEFRYSCDRSASTMVPGGSIDPRQRSGFSPYGSTVGGAQVWAKGNKLAVGQCDNLKGECKELKVEDPSKKSRLATKNDVDREQAQPGSYKTALGSLGGGKPDHGAGATGGAQPEQAAASTGGDPEFDKTVADGVNQLDAEQQAKRQAQFDKSMESPRKDTETAQRAAERGYRNDDATAQGTGNDDCKTSATINGKYSCNATSGTIVAAQAANALSQTAGSIATAAIGQSSQQKAMSEGTQSAALQAGADTQRASGQIQVSTGAVNVAMGAIQVIMAQGHKRNAAKIEEATNSKSYSITGYNNGQLDRSDKVNHGGFANNDKNQSGFAHGKNDDTHSAINNFQLQGAINARVTVTEAMIQAASGDPQRAAALQQERNAQLAAREQLISEKNGHIKNRLGQIGRNAAGEQSAMQKQALASGMMSMVTGASQATTGAFNLVAANRLEDAAKRLRGMEQKYGQVPGFSPLGPGNVNAQGADTGTATTTITGDGQSNTEQASPEEEIAKDDAFDLGGPMADLPKDELTAPPMAPGGFKGDKPSVGGGGGGGGFSGGASTQAAKGDGSDEPQAKMADSAKGSGYEGGGYMSAGAGARGGGDNGPDLSSMLAQFLPKKEDEQGKNPNGILDFGGRAPASEGPLSLLDRNANIFDRIHQTYQDKNRRGNVGI